MKNTVITTADLEKLLLRESSVIAFVDVRCLMDVVECEPLDRTLYVVISKNDAGQNYATPFISRHFMNGSQECLESLSKVLNLEEGVTNSLFGLGPLNELVEVKLDYKLAESVAASVACSLCGSFYPESEMQYDIDGDKTRPYCDMCSL